MFEKYGEILNITIHRFTRNCFAIIFFKLEEHAASAISHLDQYPLRDCVICVKYALRENKQKKYSSLKKFDSQSNQRNRDRSYSKSDEKTSTNPTFTFNLPPIARTSSDQATQPALTPTSLRLPLSLPQTSPLQPTQASPSQRGVYQMIIHNLSPHITCAEIKHEIEARTGARIVMIETWTNKRNRFLAVIECNFREEMCNILSEYARNTLCNTQVLIKEGDHLRKDEIEPEHKDRYHPYSKSVMSYIEQQQKHQQELQLQCQLQQQYQLQQLQLQQMQMQMQLFPMMPSNMLMNLGTSINTNTCINAGVNATIGANVATSVSTPLLPPTPPVVSPDMISDLLTSLTSVLEPYSPTTPGHSVKSKVKKTNDPSNIQEKRIHKHHAPQKPFVPLA